MKNIYIWLTGLLIILAVIFIGIRYSGLTEKTSTYQAVTVKELIRFSDQYDGKMISVRGKFTAMINRGVTDCWPVGTGNNPEIKESYRPYVSAWGIYDKDGTIGIEVYDENGVYIGTLPNYKENKEIELKGIAKSTTVEDQCNRDVRYKSVYIEVATRDIDITLKPSPPPPINITQEQTLETDCCSQDQIEAGFTCMQDCGPPVVNLEENYDISYSCLNPEQIENRKKYGCPVCLSSHTKISTPLGDIDVNKLRPGMIVWTVDRNGQKVAQPILKVSFSFVSKNHKVVHIKLEDGRQVWVSPGHPTINGITVENLQSGSSYDGSPITSLTLEHYQEDKTYDLLPGGETGFYFANGILLDSTLH